MAPSGRAWHPSSALSAPTARSVLLVALLYLLTARPAHAACGAHFLFPEGGETFHFHDVINVTYVSNITAPFLYCWCGGPGSVSQKAKIPNVPPLNGSVLLQLNFTSFEPCWLNLRPDSEECKSSNDNSRPFSVENAQGSQATLGLPQPSATETGGATVVADPTKGNHTRLSTGASIAIGIGATVVVVAIIGGIFAWFWLRRKKRDLEKRRQQSFEQVRGPRSPSEKLQPVLVAELRSGTHSNRSSYQQLRDHDREHDDTARRTLPTSLREATVSNTEVAVARQSRVGHDAVVTFQEDHRSLAPSIHNSTPLTASMYQNTPIEYYISSRKSEEAHGREPRTGITRQSPADDTRQPRMNPIIETTRAPTTAPESEPTRIPRRDSSTEMPSFTIYHPYDPTELPGRESHRGYGEEHELSIPHYPQPYQRSDNDAQEQKLLLDDAEVREMKARARAKGYHR